MAEVVLFHTDTGFVLKYFIFIIYEDFNEWWWNFFYLFDTDTQKIFISENIFLFFGIVFFKILYLEFKFHKQKQQIDSKTFLHPVEQQLVNYAENNFGTFRS